MPQKKRIKIKRALHGLALLLLSTLLYCCVDEQSFNDSGKGDEKSVVFSVKVPGNSTPKTRAVSSNEANVIKQIAVLLFKDGKYTHHPIYSNIVFQMVRMVKRLSQLECLRVLLIWLAWPMLMPV